VLGRSGAESQRTNDPTESPRPVLRPAGQLYALSFSRWKRASVRPCFPGCQVKFVQRVDALPLGAHAVVWGMAAIPTELGETRDIIRLEDGFLRSVGLGADLIQPLSWVVDRRGIYYDATRPSDLEVLLSTRSFDPPLLARAARLRERVVREGVTKYNVGQACWQRPGGDRRVILVPGQVESDASIVFGAPVIRRNLDLLKAVKAANPGAFVLYKPHPDVVARLRAAGAGEEDAPRWCDEVITDADMGQLLCQVDEVHVLTSLTGFEALLRKKPVTCYGQPFYAGWGLTKDVVPIPRRTRRLTLDQLVAGALISYPVYFDLGGQGLSTPEEALDQLVALRTDSGAQVSWTQRLFRVALRIVVGVR